MNQPLIVSFGGGTNSTAMIIGLWRKGIRPDLILFADTGGEMPETYEHIRRFNDWLLGRHYPEIVMVHATYQGKFETLEDGCVRKRMLPSIAYGFKACSMKHKIDPQNKYINNWIPAQECWKAGGLVRQAIGYDAGEDRRAKGVDGREERKFAFEYPLIEWGWYREECDAACIDELGYSPMKSSCFFCPNMKKREILFLQKAHPDLLARALKMEANAELTTVKGLGRSWAWADFIKNENAQGKLFNDPGDMPCGCYDGD